MTFNILKSKTAWGALLAVGAWLLQQPHITLPVVLQGVGVLVGTLGVRDALTKPTT